MVELQNVKIKYPTGDGIEHVSFKVAPGEMVFLVGPSGAGKSTVLKCIYMEEIPREGHVIVGEYNSLFIRKKQVPLVRRKLGVVFQDFKLLNDRDVFKNVSFSLEVIGIKNKEIKKRVLRALADVGLSHKSRKYPYELSGGEQQRVAIARAIVNEPYLLLADEPTGNLDPDTSAGIMEIFQRIHARGTSILIATHNYDMVSRYKGRVVRIQNGEYTGSMSLIYGIKEAFSGFKRARLSFTISVFTISFLLFIISIFSTLAFNVNQLIDVLNAKIDIQVFISSILDDTEIARLGSSISSLEQVENIEFISPDQAAKAFQKEFGEELFSILDENPLPASFNILLKENNRNIESIERLADTISKMDGVDEVDYHSDALKMLLKFSRVATIITVALLLVVILGSLFVVSNTIRLIVMARKDIIKTMWLVGATRKFISLPYILEGLIQGLLGGLLAFGFTALLFKFVGIQWPGLITYPDYTIYVLLLAGILFGFIGSVVAIKRYL